MSPSRDEWIDEALHALDEADADLLALVELQQELVMATGRIGTLVAEHTAKLADSQAELARLLESIQETQMSFNLQYLELHSQLQNENRRFTAISNIMKTKHDTVKNSLNNVR